jgi:hypothetical protein
LSGGQDEAEKNTTISHFRSLFLQRQRQRLCSFHLQRHGLTFLLSLLLLLLLGAFSCDDRFFGGLNPLGQRKT